MSSGSAVAADAGVECVDRRDLFWCEREVEAALAPSGEWWHVNALYASAAAPDPPSWLTQHWPESFGGRLLGAAPQRSAQRFTTRASVNGLAQVPPETSGLEQYLG